jgi:hypothetical protein
MSETKNLWWGYRHTSGTIQAKRYFVPLDIQEAEESGMCEEVYQPFEADNREEALAHIKGIIRDQKDGVKAKEKAKKDVDNLRSKAKLLEAFKAGRSSSCEFDDWYNENH